MYRQQEREENIFNLIPEQQQTVRKEKRYRSKYNPNAPVVGSTFGRKVTNRPGSMGKPLGCSKADPACYLKGRSAMQQMKAESRAKPFSRNRNMRKAPVPKVNERPVMGLQSTKNYVTANAVEAILAVPGNRARVQEQVPQYRHKVDYGRVPGYLGDVKEEIQRENEMIEQYLGNGESNQDDGDGGEEMPVEQLDSLIHALKTKWDNVNAQYQKICHMVKLDTIGKVRRKEKFESQLTQLEKDIQTLENRKVVVVDDQPAYGNYY